MVNERRSVRIDESDGSIFVNGHFLCVQSVGFVFLTWKMDQIEVNNRSDNLTDPINLRLRFYRKKIQWTEHKLYNKCLIESNALIQS